MCKYITLPDGSTIIACSRGDHPRGRLVTCVRCKATLAFRCDGPHDPAVGNWQDEEGLGRCSAPLCPAHAYVEEDGSHRCWQHRSPGSQVVKSEKVRLNRK